METGKTSKALLRFCNEAKERVLYTSDYLTIKGKLRECCKKHQFRRQVDPEYVIANVIERDLNLHPSVF